MIEIIKWYSIIIILLSSICNLWGTIRDRSFHDFIAFIISIPMLIYLFLK